jgi:hypothetical protein
MIWVVVVEIEMADYLERPRVDIEALVQRVSLGTRRQNTSAGCE